MNTVIALLLFAMGFFTGPAPNSGDGVPDGSGMHATVGPNGSSDRAPGPAPNSGDGIPDGSGY
jgi:hypothetical protein